MTRHVRLDEAPAPGTPEHNKIFTASKIPTIMGTGYQNSAHPQRDLLQVMAGKTQPPAPSDELQALFDLGHQLEPEAIAYCLQYYLPGAILKDTQVVYTDQGLDFPNLVTLDALISDPFQGDLILEVKSSRDPAVKQRYIDQVVYQMGVSGIHQAAIIVYPNGEGQVFTPTFARVMWDKDHFEAEITECRRWWKLINEGPAADTDLYQQVSAAAKNLEQAKQAYQKAQADYDLLAAQVIANLQLEGAKEWVVNGKPVATVRAGRFSEARLKTANPEAYEQAKQRYKITKTVFDTKALKAQNPELYRLGVGGETLAWQN